MALDCTNNSTNILQNEGLNRTAWLSNTFSEWTRRMLQMPHVHYDDLPT